MKQVLIRKPGEAEVLEYDASADIPEPRDGEVLIRNEFAGVNYIDIYHRNGSIPKPLPFCPGQEASGSIVRISGKNPHGFKIGDRVVWMGQGSYAEYSTALTDNVVQVPPGITPRDAVGGFLMGMTALSLVKEAYPVQPGDSVLVHAAAGATGQLICQILKDIGAFIIGTAGSPEKCTLAKSNGAHQCIDYNEDPAWPQRVLELTKGDGATVVYDSVGASTWEGSLKSVRRKGKVVFFGSSSGPVPPFSISRLAEKNVSIARTTLMQYITTRDELTHYANMLFRLMLDGKLTVRHHEKEYRLEDVQQAHRDLEERRTTGKLLLTA